MARTSKTAATPAAPAQPAGPRPTPATTVLRVLRARFDAADRGFRDRHARFTAETANSLTYSVQYCIGGRIEALARAQALAAWWKAAVQMLEAPETGATFRDRLTAVGLRANREILDLARHRPWEASSTDQVANILARAEASGKAEAWTEVLGFIEAMDRKEIEDDIPPAAVDQSAADPLAIGPDGQPA